MADLYYIEEGYYNPSLGYFVYTADAAAVITSSGSLSATVGVVKSTAVSLSSAFAETAVADRVISGTASATGQFTQSISGGKILSAVIDCGALFSPGITATAFKNHTAILDVVFTVNTVGAANRAASLTVDNIANLNAQAAKTVDVNSAFTSTATQLAQVKKLVDTSSTFQTQSTLAVDAFNVQFAAAALTSTSSLYTTRYFGSFRPMSGTLTGSYEFVTSPKKYGTHAIKFSSNNGVYDSEATGEFIIGANQDFVAEAWVYIDNAAEFSIQPIFFGVGATTSELTSITSASSWAIGHDLNNRYLKFTYVSNNNVIANMTTTQVVAIGQWVHIAVARANGVMRLYYNNSQVGSSVNFSEAFKLPSTAANRKFYLKSSYNLGTRTVYFDEVSYRIGSSAREGFSAAVVNEPITQVLLLHFDNNIDDDISVTQIGAAALTSAFNVNATAQELSSGQAGLSSTSTVSAAIGITRSAESAITSTATQTATATRIKAAQSSLTAAFTIDAKGHVKRNIVDADFPPAVFTQTASADRIRTATITITSAFTPTLTADVFKNMTAILDAVSTLTAQISTLANIASQLTTTATVSSAISRTRTADAAITANSALSTTAVKIHPGDASITAQASLTAVAGERVNAVGAFSSQATMASVAVKTARTGSAVSSLFAQATAAARFRSSAVAVSSQFSQSAIAVKINPGSAALSSLATLTASAVKTTTVSSAQSAVFTQTSAVNKRVNPALTFNSIATQLSVAFQNASGTVSLESTASLTAIIGSIKQGIPERAITGIRFNDDSQTELGDSFIKIAHYNSPPSGPSVSDHYAVAFWAYSPEGTVLTHNPTGNNSNGYMKFTGGSFELRSPHPSADYRTATWTGLTTSGWHHYLIYQTPIQGAENLVVKLYQDGQLRSDPTIYTFDDGNTPPAPPTDDLLAVYYQQDTAYLHWVIGASANRWRDSINEITNAAYSIEPMQGVLSQFVSYWGSGTPDFTDTATRQKLYNAGAVDLGNSGTLSGLAQPTIYLRLENYRDVRQLGSLDLYANAGSNGIPPAPRIEWRELTQFNYNPEWDNNNWLLTGLHEGSVQDNFGNGFLAIADLECAVSGVFLFELPISAEFAASISGLRVRTSTAAFTSTSTLTALATKQASAAATLNAQSTLGSVSPTRIRPGSAALSAACTIFIEEGELQIGFAALGSEFTFAATTTIILPTQGAAALTSTSILTAGALRVKSALAALTATATCSCEATLIPPIRATATLTSTATLTAVVGGRVSVASLEVAAATLTVNAVVTRSARAQITATFTQTTQPNKRTGIPLTNLQVAGFTLTAGDIINFEPSLTLVIPQETRVLLVRRESREYIIEQETRLLTLLEG